VIIESSTLYPQHFTRTITTSEVPLYTERVEWVPPYRTYGSGLISSSALITPVSINANIRTIAPQSTVIRAHSQDHFASYHSSNKDNYIVDKVIEGAVEKLTKLMTTQLLVKLGVTDAESLRQKRPEVDLIMRKLSQFLRGKAMDEMRSDMLITQQDQQTEKLGKLQDSMKKVNQLDFIRKAPLDFSVKDAVEQIVNSSQNTFRKI